MNSKTALFIALAAVGCVVAGEPPAGDRTAPTADIQDPPRRMAELKIKRDGASDAVIAGGTPGSLVDSTVTLPSACDLDPTAPGCVDEGDGGGGDPDPPPAPTEPRVGHCGLPRDHPYNTNPDYFPVQGGWLVRRQGEVTYFYQCP